MGSYRRLIQCLAISAYFLSSVSIILVILHRDYLYQRHQSGIRNYLMKLIPEYLVCKRKSMDHGVVIDIDTNGLCDGEYEEQRTYVFTRLKNGGLYKSDCVSKERTAIIIPYRDREEHLEILLNHLHPFLQKQELNYGVYVVQMAFPTQFNRGLLANAGFLTARSVDNYTCYVIHDVDLLPTNINNFYRCGNGPIHLMTNCTKYEKGLPYRNYVGGVLALTPAQFVTLNGFSNLYFGWGGEDDDIYKRINASNLVLERPINNTGTYININHTRDSSNPENPHKLMLLHTAIRRMPWDGLTSISFQRQSLEFRRKYTRVLIKVDESEVMAKFSWVKASRFYGWRNRNTSSRKTKSEGEINRKLDWAHPSKLDRYDDQDPRLDPRQEELRQKRLSAIQNTINRRVTPGRMHGSQAENIRQKIKEKPKAKSNVGQRLV